MASILHCHSLYNRLHDLRGNRKISANVDFGVKFMTGCEKFIQDHGLERSRDVVAINTTYEQIMLVAVEQINKRLPSTQNIIENLTTISTKIILSQVSRCSFIDLSFLKLFADKLTLLKDQHRKFILVDCKNEKIFTAEGIPVYDLKKFWVSILQHPFSRIWLNML